MNTDLVAKDYVMAPIFDHEMYYEFAAVVAGCVGSLGGNCAQGECIQQPKMQGQMLPYQAKYLTASDDMDALP